MQPITGFHITYKAQTNIGQIQIRAGGAALTVPIDGTVEASLVLQMLLTGHAQLDPDGSIVVKKG